MAVIHTNSHHAAVSEIHVWRCESCHCFHVHAAEMLLTLTTEEFTAFAESVTNCFLWQAAHSLLDEFTARRLFAVESESDEIN